MFILIPYVIKFSNIPLQPLIFQNKSFLKYEPVTVIQNTSDETKKKWPTSERNKTKT